jgi:hypothetical protein
VSHIAAALAKSKGKQVATPAAGTPAVPAVVAPPAAVARPALQAAVVAAAAAAAPPVPVAAAPKKKMPAWVRTAALVGALVLAGVVRWLFYLMVEAPPPAPGPVAVLPVVAPTPSVTAPKPPAPAPANLTAPSAVTSVAPAVKPVVGTTAPAAVNPPPAVDPGDLSDAVAHLPITASRQGAKPTVMIGGKLYRPGEQVTDQLTVQSVEPGRVLFQDTAGRVYERRF